MLLHEDLFLPVRSVTLPGPEELKVGMVVLCRRRLRSRHLRCTIEGLRACSSHVPALAARVAVRPAGHPPTGYAASVSATASHLHVQRPTLYLPETGAGGELPMQSQLGLCHSGVLWSCLQGPHVSLSREEGSSRWHQQRVRVHEGTQTGSPPSQEFAAGTEPACMPVSLSTHRTAPTCSLHTEADSNHCRRPDPVNPHALACCLSRHGEAVC